MARKQRAARELKAAFAGPAAGFNLTPDDVQRVLDSVADANNYLNFNAGPVRRMIKHLQDYFDPQVRRLALCPSVRLTESLSV